MRSDRIARGQHKGYGNHNPMSTLDRSARAGAPRSGWRRVVRRIPRTLCYTSPVVAIALVLVLQHRPGWYHPAQLTEAQARDARADATRWADRMGDRLVRGAPFQVVLLEENVNAWLAAAPNAWGKLIHSTDFEIEQPAIAFERDGRVRAAGLLRSGYWPLILGTTWTVALSPDRRFVELRLAGVQGGSLPVPTGIVARFAGLKSAAPTSSAVDRTDAPSARIEPISEETPSIASLIRGGRLENRFVWPNGRRAFRIRAIEIVGGEVRLAILPE
jgi:hypothetical protein